MNIHRIILAVLAAATIAVGTTTVTAYADGPNVGDPPDGGTGILVPGDVLTGTDLNNWNSLTSTSQSVMTDEIIPGMPERVPDASLRPGVLAGLVALMLDIQRQREESIRTRAVVAPSAVSGASTAAFSTTRCYFSMGVNSAGSSAMMHCDAGMAYINTDVLLTIRYQHGHVIGRSNRTCTNCTVVWSTVARSGAPSCQSGFQWYGYGTGRAEGHTEGPHPRPATRLGENTYCRP